MFLKAKKYKLGGTFLALILLGQLAVAEDATTTVTLSVTAVRATTEGNRPKHFDQSVAPCRKSLVNLRYDTFRKLKVVTEAATFGKKTRIPLNDQYTLYLTPLERQKDGRVRVKATISMKKGPDDKVVNALETTLALPPGNPLNLGGMKLDKGDLVIVLSVGKKPSP
jgi:hypothetical protein